MTVKTMLLAAGLLGVVGSGGGRSQPEDVVWQVGRFDGVGLAINGATEYPATGAFWPEFEYVIGSDVDPINAPSCPGYLHTANVCSVDPGRPCTDTARRLIVRFSINRHYDAGELKIVYGRYGSEYDSLYIDAAPLGAAVSRTNVFVLLEYWLPAIDTGDHALSIEYLPSADDTGHYIDFIAMHRQATVDVKSASWGNVKGKYEGEQ